MATRLFSDLVNRVSANASGAPQPVLVAHIRDAAIEACEKTLSWRYIQADQTLVDGTSSYAFVPPDAFSEVHAVLSAEVNGNPLSARSLEDTVRVTPKFPDTSTGGKGTPQYFTHIDPDNYYVVPTPDGNATYTLRMILALKPIRSATGMDQAIMDDLETVIMHGALQSLLVLPGQPWTDLETAAYHAKQYAYKTAERRARTNVGSGRAVMTARAIPFA